MSRCVSRTCSTKCHGVYGTLGGRSLIASIGKSETASSKGMCAPTPSSSWISCSRWAWSEGAIGLVADAEVPNRDGQHDHAKGQQDPDLGQDRQHRPRDVETQLVEGRTGERAAQRNAPDGVDPVG